jgi:tRNA(adenine34) deaminase
MPEYTHEYFMGLALREAERAADAGEVPTGCVIAEIPTDELAGPPRILGRAHNQVELLKDATAHAEMIAITQASCSRGDWRLTDTVLYVTKEPCAMCAGAIVLSRIPRVVFGAPDPRRGGAVSLFRILSAPELNHQAEVISGVLEAECRSVLQAFFRARRSETG